MVDKISLKDVYEIVNRVEDKMDAQLADHNKRIDVLENNQAKAFGVLSVITVFVSAGASYLWDRVLGRR